MAMKRGFIKEGFVRRVWQKLIDKDMTVRELAEKTELPEDEIKRVLGLSSGLSFVDVVCVAKIAKSLGVSIEYLIGATEFETIFTADKWGWMDEADGEL